MEPDIVLVGLVILICLWALFGLTFPAQKVPMPPAQVAPDVITVEREQLILKVDLELQAAEIRLRSNGLTQAAEGAALVRARTIEFLKGFRP